MGYRFSAQRQSEDERQDHSLPTVETEVASPAVESLSPSQRSVISMQQRSGNAATRNRIQRDPPADAPRRPPPPISVGSLFNPVDPVFGTPLNVGGPRPEGPVALPAVQMPQTAGNNAGGTGGDHAVTGQISVNFKAKQRVAGAGSAGAPTITNERQTTGEVGEGAEIEHTQTDEGHEFQFTLNGTVGSTTLESQGTIKINNAGEVTELSLSQQGEWSRNYLNNVLRVRGFVQGLVQAAQSEEGGGSVSGSVPVTLTPSAQVTGGISARFNFGRTTLTFSGQTQFTVPSLTLESTVSADLSTRIWGPLSFNARGSGTMNVGPRGVTGSGTGRVGLGINAGHGLEFNAGVGITGGSSDNGGRADLQVTGGAVYHF